MTKQDQEARAKLINYAARFLNSKAEPHQPVAVTLEQIAAFAAQVRAGCRQDLIRLIDLLVKDDLHDSGTDALRALAGTISEGESIELWGLPDCACQKSDCVYCGPKLNTVSSERA